MAKTYRSYLPEQDLLLPPSLREWLPDDHLVYLVSDVVGVPHPKRVGWICAGHNTQIAVEPLFRLIVGQRVTQAANDKQLVPLVETIEEQSGQTPEGVLADKWVLLG